MYRQGAVSVLERDEYVSLVCDFLERLPAEMVVHRLSGEAPPDYLVAPAWCLDKPGLLWAVDVELLRRDSWQGKRFQGERRGVSPPVSGERPASRERVPLPLVAPEA
jgi:radical SAM superfamily enzyme